jgi:hypothetical protein
VKYQPVEQVIDWQCGARTWMMRAQSDRHHHRANSKRIDALVAWICNNEESSSWSRPYSHDGCACFTNMTW